MEPTVLVTGASSGIGAELARLFAVDGYRVILLARDEAKLTTLAHELENGPARSVHVVPCDLAEPGCGPALVERLRAEGLRVTALVNNAGFGACGEFASLPHDRQIHMIQVNLTSLTSLTHLLLPELRASGAGEILNVASTAAFQPGPYMAVYYATKAYVLHFTEALAVELAGERVKVTCLCPGPTKTEFQAEAGLEETMLVRIGLMSAVRAARAGYDGLKRSRTICIPGIGNKLGAFGVRFMPRWLLRRIVARLQNTGADASGERGGAA